MVGTLMPLQNLLNLGQVLKEKREDQGLSLEKISDWTKISVSTLQAIEEAQVDKLPVYTYLRGFILSYAKALGMDEKEVEKELKSLLLQNENLPLHNVTPFASASSAATENFVEKDLRLTPVILAVSILFILGSILVLTNVIQSYKKDLKEGPVGNSVQTVIEKEKTDKGELEKRKKNEVNVNSSQKSAIQPEQNKDPKKSVSALSVKKKPINHQNTSLELVVKALGEVNIFYQVDEKEEKQIFLKEDQFEVLRGEKNILIKTDNSDLIYIFHNGKDIGLFGSGGKKEKVFKLNH